MRKIPLLLSDQVMPVYKFALIFSFMLGFASVFTGIIYALFMSSASLGFILFIKGAALTAIISSFGFAGLWKRHQLNYEHCRENNTTDCMDLGFFNLA